MIALKTTLTSLLAAAILVPVPTAAQTHRDSWQRTADVAVALGAVPGAHVADIGAGDGYFTRYLQEAVGSGGRVYAVDISRETVARLRGRLDVAGARNVDVILGAPDDPRLPFGSLDGALIVNAYHEFTEYVAMLEAIRQALKPGGRLVIVDNPPDDPASTRNEQTAAHNIDIGLVSAELRDAGFVTLHQDSEFIADSADGHNHRMWLLSVRRPLQDPLMERFPDAAAGPEGQFACPFPADHDALAERPSPADSVETRLAATRVKVCYSRPSMRGRTIMGGLVPFGEPWRTGANEATVLRTDRPVSVGDIRLEPGWYSLYTVPEPDAWTVVLNRLPDRMGIPIDDWVRSHDVGRLTVPVESTGQRVERLTIRFEPVGADSAALIIEWERTRARIPVAVM